MNSFMNLKCKYINSRYPPYNVLTNSQNELIDSVIKIKIIINGSNLYFKIIYKN